MIADSGRATTLEDLLRSAQDESLSPTDARAVGARLADEYLRNGRVSEAPLADFSTEAYIGFDRRVASVQARAGLPR